MKTTSIVFALVAALLPGSVAAQSAAFTYQGKFTDAGAPYTGPAELQFTVWDAASGGAPVATNNPPIVSLGVTNGVFDTTLDFGVAAFPGADRWLEIAVRTTLGSFTALAPRQRISSTPYALRALAVASNGLAAGSYDNAVAFTNAANVFAGTFTGTLSGSGAGLTGLDAGSLAVGTVPLARLPDAVARTNQVWLLAGNPGTVPGTDFLGTTDDAPLVLRASNRDVLRLEGEASGFRIIAGNLNAVDAASTNSTVLGGRGNRIDAGAHESSIVGGSDNRIFGTQRSAFIGGGARNQVLTNCQHAVIVGGRDNRIGTNTLICAVLGGAENRISDNVDGGLIVAGFRNDILGSANPPSREIAPVILGGSDNDIGLSSSWAVILGGDNNHVGTNAPSGVILGGTNNFVANNAGFALAAGCRAHANHPGAFVWGDSNNSSVSSSAANQFTIRASGGIRLFSNSGLTTGVSVAPGSGTWASISDRNAKENVEPVDPRQVLDAVAGLPLARWNYKSQDRSVRHIGPMAQDFHAAFGVGENNTTITTVDADGVALAAIQGLNQKLEEQRTQIESKDRELAALKQRLDRLEQRLGPER